MDKSASGKRVVIQEEPYGCGIASVANIIGLTYSEVKTKANSMGISAEDEQLFSDTEHVRKLLASYDIDTISGETQFVSWDQLPNLALLAIKYRIENSKPYWHWVVFEKTESDMYVMDSSMSISTHKRYDFDEIHPKWFIEVIRHDMNGEPLAYIFTSIWVIP